MIKRGEIYYIEPAKTVQSTGSEQRPNRPGIIVSNNVNNEHSTTVEIVYLTTQPKNELPTHVIINNAAKKSIALCEQITSVSVDRLTNYMGQCSDEEMEKIENAILISLGIAEINNNAHEKEMKAQLEIKDLEISIMRKVYKELTEFLITRITNN